MDDWQNTILADFMKQAAEAKEKAKAPKEKAAAKPDAATGLKQHASNYGTIGSLEMSLN